MNNVIITQIKNQEDRVYDWGLYHYKEGFDTFIIFDDFSKDNTLLEIERLKNNFNINIQIYSTDEVGSDYSIKDSRNSEAYGYDVRLQKKMLRSYTKGNEIVKSTNPKAICAFLDVDEFLTTDENEKVSEVINKIFQETKCTQLFVYNFDVKNEFSVEKGYIYNHENYYRWDFNDMNNHPTWKDRKKCIIVSSSVNQVRSVHEIYLENEFSHRQRNYQKLRMHHYRTPNLPNSGDIKFILDNNIKERMLSHLK